jgi:hypothetical protein
MKDLIEKIVKLIDVKSLVTLSLTGVFAYLSVIGKLDPADFMMIFAMIMTFYFAKKDTK